MPLGLIKEYDKQWPQWFKQIESSIRPNIEGNFISIEHVGSTSVEGMNAKPIIDVDIIIRQENFPFIKMKLHELGYSHQGDLGIKGREAFELVGERRKNALPQHHLYVCYEGEFELKKHLAFRDHLKRDKNDRNRLVELKRRLEQTCNTRQEYIEKKDGLVQEITERALKAYCGVTGRNLLNVRIESSRLQLIPITEEYAEEIFSCFDEEITRFMYPKPAEKIEETYQFIRSSIEGLNNSTNLQLIILKKLSNEFVGCAGLHRINTKTPELGIWTKKDSHGNGYGLEAITAMVTWAKQNVEFEYLVYPVDKRNYPSRRIPEINGGIPSKVFKKVNQQGFELDEIEYRIYNSNSERAAAAEE